MLRKNLHLGLGSRFGCHYGYVVSLRQNKTVFMIYCKHPQSQPLLHSVNSDGFCSLSTAFCNGFDHGFWEKLLDVTHVCIASIAGHDGFNMTKKPARRAGTPRVKFGYCVIPLSWVSTMLAGVSICFKWYRLFIMACGRQRRRASSRVVR